MTEQSTELAPSPEVPLESEDALNAEFAAMQAADAEFGEMPAEDVESPIEDVETPEAEPLVEASEEAAPVPEPPKQNNTVPLATFLETRNDLKATKQALVELQQQIEALKPVEEVPSIDEDPVGHLEHQNKVTQKSIEELANEMKQATANQQIQQVRQHVENLEKSFVAEHADYYDALAHLQQSRANQHALIGVPAPDAVKAVNDELTWVTQNAITNGKNPAEVVYALAKSMGFTGVQNSQAGAKTLKELAKAQESSSTLANVPGQTGSDKLDVSAANNMSDAEFDKNFLGDDEAFKALMS